MSDLNLAHDFLSITETKFKTLVSEFENGTEQRRSKWGTSLKKFTLTYKNRGLTDKNTIETLFNSQKGAYDSFTWTNPEDSIEYTVRFVDDSLKTTLKAYQVWDIDFELQQVK